MKNALLLGITALLLFGLSAGLSLWLTPPVVEPSEEPPATTTPRKSKAGQPTESKPAVPRAVVPPTPAGDVGDAARLAEQLREEAARAARREEDAERQQDMYRFVLEDIRYEMQSLQKLWQRAMERPQVLPTELPPPAATPPREEPPLKKTTDSIDPKNLSRVTGISESMPPEAAARIVEQLVRAGKIDAAVQLLAKMNPRQAAKILAAIPDEKLSTQVFEKLLEARRPAGDPRD